MEENAAKTAILAAAWAANAQAGLSKAITELAKVGREVAQANYDGTVQPVHAHDYDVAIAHVEDAWTIIAGDTLKHLGKCRELLMRAGQLTELDLASRAKAAPE
jgi:hypothetical protein